MSNANYLFTSESVSEGHPDKVSDCISDSILDAMLTIEPESRSGLETLCTTNKIVLAGEIRGPESITKDVMEEIARSCVREIAYAQEGFPWKTPDVDALVPSQSADIAQGFDSARTKDE